jgi:hypothetical protein
VNEGKMKVVFCDESVVGNRKKKNKRSVFGDIEVDWFLVCLFGVNKVMSLVVVGDDVCVFKRGEWNMVGMGLQRLPNQNSTIIYNKKIFLVKKKKPIKYGYS